MLTKEEVEQLKGQHPGEVVCAVLNHICENGEAGYEAVYQTVASKGRPLLTAIEAAVGGKLLLETAGGGPEDDAFLGFTWDRRGAAGT